MKKKRAHINAISTPANIILTLIFSLASLAAIVPMLIVLGTSLTDNSYVLQHGYSIIPRAFSTWAYSFTFKDPMIVLRAYGVTIVCTVTGTVLGTLIMSMYAYAICRRDYRYRRAATVYMFITMVFSGGMIPTYIVVTQILRMRDTLWALIIPACFAGFYVIILRTFYKSAIPESLIESAKLDGAGEFRIFFQIIYPLSVPGLATVALFMALQYWNDFFSPLLYLRDNVATLQNLSYMIYQALVNTQMMMKIASLAGQANLALQIPTETYRLALAIVCIGPLVVAYPFFQRYFIKGLTIGAIKG